MVMCMKGRERSARERDRVCIVMLMVMCIKGRGRIAREKSRSDALC